MSSLSTPSTLAHTFCPVKSEFNSQLPLFPDSMIHHKEPGLPDKIIVSYPLIDQCKAYGVSPSRRVLSPQLLLKKFDQVRDCLANVLELTTAEREVTFRLLRFWAYYGYVYPKASTVASEPGCSKATFWRTVAFLERLGLLRRINRYVIRPHAQISNLYRLDRLVLVIARYLAEHGIPFLEKWLRPMLAMPGSHFWTLALAAARETDFEGRAIFPILTPPAFSK